MGDELTLTTAAGTPIGDNQADPRYAEGIAHALGMSFQRAAE